MKHYAYGYADHDPLVAPDPVTIVPVADPREYDALVSARHDLWWEMREEAEWWERPTEGSRMIGALLAVAVLLSILGIVGWIEGL